MKKTFLTPAQATMLTMGAGSAGASRFFRANLSPDIEGGSNGADDEGSVKSMLEKIENKLAAGLDAKAAKAVQEEIKSLQTKIEADKTASSTEIEAVKSMAQGIKDTLDLLDVKVQKISIPQTVEKTKSFNEVLMDTLEENKEAIQKYSKADGKLELQMKAVGDMSTAANFPASTALYQEQRPLYVPPFEQTFLGDILPGGSASSGSQIVYPELVGGEGGIDEWDGTEDKPAVDYDFATRTVTFAWLAGIVVIEREMLDDIAWLGSFLQQRLLLDLKTRENAFILNRATTGLLAKATAYNGTYTVPVERLIDAAYGQLPEDTFDQHRTTHFVMRPRDTVKIGLNKAEGSQEFDLPQGTVGFTNGALNLSGIQTVATTSMAANNFLAMDARATQFIKRLQPELRLFEDATLAKQNKLMFRIEERVALATYNPKALVKGLLEPTP